MERKTPIWKKIIKTIIFVVFIVIFSLVATTIAYYASGYKINLKARKIQKNGMILIDYRENEIEILLDGKKVDYTKGRQGFWAPTNYIISTLPGKYNLEIIKQGKLNYSENITVDEEMIARIENIILIPEKIQEKNVLDKKVQQYCVSPDNKNIIYQSDSQMHLYDIESDKDLPLSKKLNGIEEDSCSWGTDSKKAAIKNVVNNNNIFYILNIEEPEKSFFLHDALSFVPLLSNVYFSYLDNNILLGIAKNEIYKINTNAKEVGIIENNIRDIYENGFVFYSKIDSENLYRINPITYFGETILENIKRNDDFEIVFSDIKNIYIKNDRIIYLVKDKNNLEVIDKEADSIVESKINNGFFYNKGFELWFYNINNQKKQIISRFSQFIKKAETYYNGHILHVSEKELGVIRENGENNQNIKTIENIQDFGILDKEKILLITRENEGYVFKILDMEIVQQP